MWCWSNGCGGVNCCGEWERARNELNKLPRVFDERGSVIYQVVTTNRLEGCGSFRPRQQRESSSQMWCCSRGAGACQDALSDVVFALLADLMLFHCCYSLRFVSQDVNLASTGCSTCSPSTHNWNGDNLGKRILK